MTKKTRLKEDANRYPFLKALGLNEVAENSLTILLDKTISGDTGVIRSGFASDESPQEILAKWDKVFQANLVKVNEPLLMLEESNRSKYGPRSVAIPWVERKDGVFSYFGENREQDSRVSQISSDHKLHPRKGIIGTVQPLSVDKAVLYLKNGTNSGLPYMQRKGLVKDDVLSHFRQILSRKDPCAMFTRTQEALKTRAVWGFPIADTLNEMRFYQPLLAHQKVQPWRSAIRSPVEVDYALDSLIRSAVSNNQALVSLDFSAYDSTIKRGLQSASFDFIGSIFRRQFLEELFYIRDRFGTIGLITPDGIKQGWHGVPSGSTFTNEVDSIAQFILAKQIGHSNLDLIQIQGDDGAYASSDPDSLFEGFNYYGLNVNVEKSYTSKDYLVYLQNLYCKDYLRNGIVSGVYPVYRALNRIVYQERFTNFSEYGMEGSDYYAIRTISILENCRNHPLFKELVKFIVDHDKYGLRITQQSVKQYIQMLIDKSGAEGLIENQYGDKIQGIMSFDTVRLINEL